MRVSTIVKNRGGSGEPLIFPLRPQLLRDHLSMDLYYQSRADFGVSYPQALSWTLESLDEDLDLERFFAAIPGFWESRRVVDPVGTFIIANRMTKYISHADPVYGTRSVILPHLRVRQANSNRHLQNGHLYGVTFHIPTDSRPCSPWDMERTIIFNRLRIFCNFNCKTGGLSAVIHLSISVGNAWLYS